jgi:hypothetical protein
MKTADERLRAAARDAKGIFPPAVTCRHCACRI